MAVIGDLVVRYGATTAGFDRGTKRVRGGLASITKGIKRMIGIMAPLAGGALFVGMLRSAEDFNQKMRRSLAIMGDVSVEMQKKMSASAFAVARDTTFSASQAAESYFFLASAGLSAEQSLAALPIVASFAQSGMFDLAKASDLLTDAQSALGMTTDDAAQNLENMTRLADVLVKANTLANASVEQFAESLTNKAAAAARIVGKEVEEVVAVLAAFADQGLKASEAGTAFNIVMRDLQTKALLNKQAFEEAGIAVFDTAGEMNNIADIIGDLERKLDGMADSQKKATLTQLGFADKSVIFIQTLIGMSERISEYERELRNAAGTMDEVANKQLTTMEKAMAKLQSAAVQLGTAFNEQVVPAVAVFLQMVTGLFKLLGPLVPIILLLTTVMIGYALATKAAAASQIVLLSLFGPKGWIVLGAAVGIAATAMIAMNAQLEDVIDNATRAANKTNDLAKAEKVLADQVSRRPFSVAGGRLVIGAGPQAIFRQKTPEETALQLRGLSEEGGPAGLIGATGRIGELAREVTDTVAEIKILDKSLQDLAARTFKQLTTGEGFIFSNFREVKAQQIGDLLREIEQKQRELGPAATELLTIWDKINSVFGTYAEAQKVAARGIESLITPLEKYEQIQKRLNLLMFESLITMEQSDQLRAKALEDLDRATGGAGKMLQTLRDEFRLLNGEITESELALEKLVALGADPVTISLIREAQKNIVDIQAKLEAKKGLQDAIDEERKGILVDLAPRPEAAPAVSAGAAVTRGSAAAFSAIIASLRPSGGDRQKQIAKNTKDGVKATEDTNKILSDRQLARVNWQRA